MPISIVDVASLRCSYIDAMDIFWEWKLGLYITPYLINFQGWAESDSRGMNSLTAVQQRVDNVLTSESPTLTFRFISRLVYSKGLMNWKLLDDKFSRALLQ